MTKLSNKDLEDQVAVLVVYLGIEALDIHAALAFASNDEHKDMTKTLDYLKEHFVVKQNVIYERSHFNTRNQEEGKTIPHYITGLRQLPHNC